MSTKLRSDTALIIGKGALSRVWYLDLAHVEQEFLSVAALALRPAVYEAREQLPVTTFDPTVTPTVARPPLRTHRYTHCHRHAHRRTHRHSHHHASR